MRGWNLMPLLLAASVLLGGLARAAAPDAPDAPPQEAPSPGEQSYARGLLAALEDPDDEVVAWALRTLVVDTRFMVDGRSRLRFVDLVPGVRERLLGFLWSPRAARALEAQDGHLYKAILFTQAALGAGSPDTARRLVGLLAVERDQNLREEEETALAKLGEAAREQAPRLVEMMKEQDPLVFGAPLSASTVLEKLGGAVREQVPRLGELLEDPDRTVRSRAARILGELGGSASTQAPRLGKLLEDPDRTVRQSAAEALGKMGEAAAPQIPRLLERLEDPEALVRAQAVEALGKMGEAAVPRIPRLRKLLRDPRDYVRSSAQLALRNLGEFSGAARKASREQAARERANRALAARQDELKRQHPEAFEPLTRAERQRRESGARALAALLAHSLKSPDPKVRLSALRFIEERPEQEPGFVTGEQAKSLIPPVAQLLEDPDALVRNAAVKALILLGAREHVPRIAALRTDPDAEVRYSAARALGALGAREYASSLIDGLKEVPASYGAVFFGGELRALIGMSPLALEEVARLAAEKDGNPESRPLWLARAHGLGGGEPHAERVLRWLGRRDSSQLPRLTLQEARATLQDFAALWPAAAKSPALAGELSQQTAQVAMLGRGQWEETDRALLELHEQHLRGFQPTRAASVRAVIDSIPRHAGWPRTAAWSWGAHAGLWLLLVFVYPRSAKVQAVFFWNPWVRRILGLGYVGVLLTWVPLLRRRLLSPFQPLLVADADLGRFSPQAYFTRSEVLVVATGQRLPLLEALPRVRGLVVLEGASGLGKSMFIRHLLRTSRALAVYLPAERCGDGVLEAIQAKLEGLAKDTGFLQSLLYSGALDLYIDGLNEVSADTRTRIVQFVEARSHGNILLATQRMEWRPPAAARQYELQPLTEAQVREFLLGREPLLPERAPVRGEAYREACGDFLAQALAPGEPVLSNPMDLTVVAQLLSEGQRPDLFHLQEQQYALMARDYQEVNLAEFPLEALSEEAYRMRLEDRSALPEERFGKELLRMEAYKMVVRREWRGAEGQEVREWHFRHDKLRDFFIAQTFLGQKNERIGQHLDDPRFRGVYLLLERLLPPERARELRGLLVVRAAETQDHTVSDAFIQQSKARRRGEQARPFPPDPREAP